MGVLRSLLTLASFPIVFSLLTTSHVPSLLGIPSNSIPDRVRTYNVANDDDDVGDYSAGDFFSRERGSVNETVVTREMFQREMLKDPVVKRKKGKSGSSLKILDNRDSMPFRVEDITPDPYKPTESNKKKAKTVPRRPGAVEDGFTASKVFLGGENDEMDGKTVIGEFFLDRLTTTGDLLEIGETQYKVTRHKCQYKYAGGQRFVMVKKVLQVKEIGRLMKEEYLSRQWDNS